MADDRPTSRHGSAELHNAALASTEHLWSRGEAIHLRSYDHQWGYDVDVEVRDMAGDLAYRERYYLLPGHVTSENPGLPSGTYEVCVTLDNHTEREFECRIDETPDNTVVIEVGNGAVAVSQGLRV